MFVASTWCGYLGVLTGMKSHGFSVSINYRSGKGQVADNFAAGKEGGWPVGFLVRNVLETESSYEGALRRLREAPLMAPTYMIVAGVHPGEGICLSRTRDGIKDTCQQTLKKPITQTNVDCKSEYQHRDARTSAPRRVCSVFFLKEHKDRLTRETAWELLHKPPINNGITLYGTVMIPAEGYYDTRVPDDTVLRELTARLAGAQAADSSVAEQGGYVLELLKECWREHGALGGELKPDALEKIVQSWYLLQSSDVRLVLMRARAQFEKFDADGSGFVQGDELDLLAEFTLTRFAPEGRALSAEVQQQVKERLLQGADSNSDGRLEFQEFADWFQHSVSECWNPSCDAQEEHSTMDGGPQTAPEVLVPRLPSTSIAPAPAEEHEHHSVSEQLQEGMQRFEFKPDDSLLFHQFVSMFVQCAAFQSLDLPDKVAVEVLCASAELAPSNQESRVTRAWVLPVLIGVALLLQMFCCNFF